MKTPSKQRISSKLQLCERASPSLITFQFQSLVVSLLDIVEERVFMWYILHIWPFWEMRRHKNL